MKNVKQQQSAQKEHSKGYHVALILDTICIPQVYFLSAINENLKVNSYPPCSHIVPHCDLFFQSILIILRNITRLVLC